MAQRVDAICDRFEAAWKAGQRPGIEDHLADASEAERPVLLCELIALEVIYRRRRGEEPKAEDYESRFAELDPVWLACALEPSERPDLLVSGSTCPPEQSIAVNPSGPSAGPDPVGGFAVVPGGVASRYEILNEVGRGVVYRARHKTLDKEVAIKILLPGASLDRFVREAKLLAKIRSPHVVAVHDFDILSDGRPLLVMEWVEGNDLSRCLRAQRGALSEENVLPWMRQTCEGMLAAANEGIIHRDLKPSNILIDNQGRARVADFGLARGPTSLGDLSQSGSVMGTPYYMAPEQAEDPRRIDTRADVYSFGATFYHALTGSPPFEGATPFAVPYKHKTEPLISPKARNPFLSERTSQLLERCLAKSPNDRFPSFANILQQLQPAPGALWPWETSDDAQLAPYLARYQGCRGRYLWPLRQYTTEVDTYEFPHGRLLNIRVGNIVEEALDAIVSSDDAHLSMGGGVSAWIRRAAGPAMVEEARRYVPVRPGRAVVTSAGNLPARFIFHGVTIGRLDGQRVYPSRDLISEIMASCFYHADSLQVCTIAFPLLGTGAGVSRRRMPGHDVSLPRAHLLARAHIRVGSDDCRVFVRVTYQSGSPLWAPVAPHMSQPSSLGSPVSRQYRLPALVGTYTRPWATAGWKTTGSPTAALHSTSPLRADRQ
jgi:serine/threonine protein kinase